MLPNELILNIALLNDFNRFRFKDFSSGITEDDDIDESMIFRGLQRNDKSNEIKDTAKDDFLPSKRFDRISVKYAVI